MLALIHMCIKAITDGMFNNVDLYTDHDNKEPFIVLARAEQSEPALINVLVFSSGDRDCFGATPDGAAAFAEGVLACADRCIVEVCVYSPIEPLNEATRRFTADPNDERCHIRTEQGIDDILRHGLFGALVLNERRIRSRA